MKIRIGKWLIVFVLILFLSMGQRTVYAQEVVKLAELDLDTGVRDTDYYSYTYTEENKITIDGAEYAGIVIPIEHTYAGGVDIIINGIKNVTTTDGEVYCGLFDDESLSVGEVKKASMEMVELYKGYGETGIRYLVFYNDSYEGTGVTTDIQFQAGLYYRDGYEMKENIVYKNYAKDGEHSNYAYINITKPGYYIFETNQDLTLRMSLSGDCSIIPANYMPIVGKTDHKVMINLRNAGEYDLSMTSKNGVPFSFTYYYYPSEKLEFTETNSVPIYIGDKITGVSINYTADKSGVVQLAGVSKGSGQATIKQFYKDGTHVGYDRIVSTSSEITNLTKESFFVRKGERYYFIITPTSKYGYLNASFKITDFAEAEVLGKPTKEEARAAKAGVQYDTVYHGSFDRRESTSSWIYIDKPCRVHFDSFKKKENESYTLNYYDGDREVLTTYVQNDNREVKFLVLDEWTPGFLEINDGAGGGYYTLLIENMEETEETVPDVGSILEGTDATYKVTVAPDKDSKAGGVVRYMKIGRKKSKTIAVPDTITINDITYKVSSIDNSAFAGNKNIISVAVGNNVTKMSAKTFKGCTNLKTVKLGNGVTGVPAKMFKNFKKLTTVKMGNKVKTIGDEAFSGCVKLSNVTIGKNVTSIGDKAFYKCSSLTKITIPSKVSKIGEYAFQNCKRLKNLSIKTTKLTSKKTGKSAFKGVGSSYYKKVKVTVPAKKLKSYKILFKKAGLSPKVKVKK